MNNNNDTLNVELSPDNIYGYIVTTQAYEESQDDKRKRDIFYWKAYHFYPVIYGNQDELDEDSELSDIDLIICTEGGDKDTYNSVTMSAAELRNFVRQNTSFRLMSAEAIFEELNIV